MNNEMIVKTLRELPQLIKKAEEKLLILEEALAHVKIKIEMWEGQELLKIMESMTKDGKKEFPNEHSRSVELRRRKNASEEFRDMEEERKRLLHEIGQAKIQLNYQRNRLKVGEAISRLVAK